MLANLLYHSPCALCITDATQPDMPIVSAENRQVFEQLSVLTSPLSQLSCCDRLAVVVQVYVNRVFEKATGYPAAEVIVT